MKLSLYSKNNINLSFKKIKFYNLIIKTLLNQNLIFTASFQNVLLKYLSNLTQITSLPASRYTQSLNFQASSRTWFQKIDATSSYNAPRVSLKHQSLTKLENLESLKLFQLFLKISCSEPFLHAKVHYLYRLLFNTSNPNLLASIDLGKAYSRWSTTQTLLINLFYFNIKVISFGNKLLINEILSLNWKLTSSELFSHSHFRKSLFFTSAKTGPLYARNFYSWSKLKIENAFVFDLNFHQRTIFFLRRYNFFTMGIVAAAQNPWLLDHPIPVFSSTILTQYYFLKLFTYTFSVAKNLYFTNCKSLWLKLYF
jgi:hypothetical protein